MSKDVEPFGAMCDRAVYLPTADALVAADLHLGMTVSDAIDAPIDEGPGIVDRLADLLDRFEPSSLVLAGDVLHAFDAVPRAASAAVAAIEALVTDADVDLEALAGNHDAHLPAILTEPPADSLELPDGTVVCHGHEPPTAAGRRYVVGHDHPVIEIEGRRRPCFLYGRAVYGDADVLALPPFSSAVRGSAVNDWTDGDPLSPFLTRVSRFYPLVCDRESGATLTFPELESLQPYL